MHYRIDRPKDDRAAAILDATLQSLSTDDQMQTDLARLSKACYAPERYIALQGAPVPAPVAEG